MKIASKGIHPGFETQDITGSLKQGYQWPHKKDWCPPISFKKWCSECVTYKSLSQAHLQHLSLCCVQADVYLFAIKSLASILRGTPVWNPTKKPSLPGQLQQISLFNSMSTSIFGQVPGFLLKATEITRVESLKLGSPDKKSKQLLPAASWSKPTALLKT